MNIIFWNDIYTWVKDEPITSSAIGNAVFALIIVFTLELSQCLIQKTQEKPITGRFPFRRIKPNELGQWLMEKGDRIRLTCYENPYVPKELDIIYKSSAPESERRKIYIGTAEIGKTRAAYEWIMNITGDDKNAEILIPMYELLPNPISKDTIPHLEETVVLLCDEMQNCLLSARKEHQKDEDRILSPVDRFEKLIDLLQRRCTKLYVVCTVRWERNKVVKSVENLARIWKTFDIMTLKDAEHKSEADMIKGFANYLNVNLEDGVAEAMAEINHGRSYENTVTFLQGWDKEKKVTYTNLDDYKKGASKRWQEHVFFELKNQNPFVALVIGAMYTLRFKLGLPLYRRFIIMCAEINTDGFFNKRRLKGAMRLMSKYGFHYKGDKVSCPDYQLEIEGCVSPSAQECVERLYNQRQDLSIEEQNSLTEWYFSKAYDLYDKGEFELSAAEYEKIILLTPDYHQAYNNWGLALHQLASLKKDESLYEQSIQKYQKAVELIPDDEDAYYNWGNALSDLAKLRGDESLYEQSIQKYQKAVELIPDDEDVYNNWGVALRQLASLKKDESLYEQSIQKYQKAVELKPDVDYIYSNWGTALYYLAELKGDESLYEQSIQKYQKAVELKPDYHLAYYNWGLALSDLAKLKRDEQLYEQSIQKYQKAVELKPDYHLAYYNWGLALFDLAKLKGDEQLYEQSIQKYQKFLEFNPQYWGAYFVIACAYALIRRAREACQALTKAFLINPEVVNMVNTDSDFDPIQYNPIFQQWLEDHSKKA